jgi:hypothetical protein
MARSSKKARRLVVGSEIFLWSLGHEHRAEHGRYLDCREVLTIRRHGARGRLRIFFQEDPGRLVPDGYAHSGAVGTTEGGWLNLNEPGTVRALLVEARTTGWQPDDPSTEQIDGWTLFDTVASRRNMRSTSSSPRAWREPSTGAASPSSPFP